MIKARWLAAVRLGSQPTPVKPAFPRPLNDPAILRGQMPGACDCVSFAVGMVPRGRQKR
jgi:hypothetical protein